VCFEFAHVFVGPDTAEIAEFVGMVRGLFFGDAERRFEKMEEGLVDARFPGFRGLTDQGGKPVVDVME
jgi:hypothetical protein